MICKNALYPLVFAMLLGGCAGTVAVNDAFALLPMQKSCETEAKLLTQSVDVYSAPSAGSDQVVRLAAGRFLYRCEARGNWLGVMFPQEGERVDCSVRLPENACARGWVYKSVQMDILG